MFLLASKKDYPANRNRFTIPELADWPMLGQGPAVSRLEITELALEKNKKGLNVCSRLT